METREVNLNNFPNLLDNIEMSDFELLFQIKDYKLTFPQVRNEKVEWQMDLPMFVTPFYDYLILNKKIPSQEEYWNFYQSVNSEYFVNKSFDEDILFAIQSRVFRTYPSLVRDIHFALFLKQRINNYKIIYNTDLDIQEGIDLLMVNDSKTNAINCFTETDVARKGRVKKQYKHKNFNNVNYIDLPVQVSGPKTWGDFYLYGLPEMNKIVELVV